MTETAYDRVVEYQLRDDPQWRQVITKRPVQQSMPGDVVTFTLMNDLAHATTPLTETVDPDAVAAPAPTRVLVTLAEYGNATLTTERLERTAFINVDPAIAMLIARNQADSLDDLVRAIADASTNILHYNSGTLTTAQSASPGTDVLTTTADIMTRKPAVAAVTLLRRAKVNTLKSNKYVSMIHPDVAYDLQAEAAATAWVGPHTYGTDTEAIYSGQVGTYMGASYLETTRTTISATAAASSAPLYSTYFLGDQAIAEASAVEPHVVVGPQIDKLKRFSPLGWYGLLGWGLYRPKALVIVKTQSSLGGV